LFDGAVAYLAQTREDSRETIRTVIQEFYVTSKQSSGDPVGLMQSAAIRERFASENVPMAYRKKRTVLMHLLHHGVLVTEPLDVIEHDHHDYQWSHDKNDQLSTLGYEHYIRFTKNILEEDMPAKASLYKHHDLSTTQQFALLKITDELAAIGRLDVEEDVLDSTNKLAELSKGLGSLINNYQGSWFKSIERKTQLVALRDMVNRCLNEPNETSRYEVVMGAISRAKYAAIDNDRVKDRDRKWFKLNRSGHSRYLNTLNQMQDLVIRHWVQDSPALLAFQNYQQFSRNDFKELTQRFCERVTDYSEETYLEANDPRNRQLDQRVFNFFINEDVKVRLQALKVGFEAFIQADGPLEDADNIEQLINDLRKTMPKLSGHLITLGNELLSRGDALLMHLREQEQMNAAGRDNSLAC